MEKKIDLSSFLTALKKNLKILLIIPFSFLVIGILVSILFMQPKYAATSQVLVNQKEPNNEMMAQQVQSNIQLVKTYSEIIKSPRILDKVSKELNGKYSEKELSNMLTVNNQAESQIMNINIESKNKKDAAKVANTITKVFSKDASKIMNIDNVSTLSKAETAKKVSPKPVANGIIGLILGLVIALVVIMIKELFDRRIKTEKEVEEILGLPVLGSISDFSKKK
ncbi:MAG: Wzz/FepE/Etk N-terminal domain-containing protein [Staphylococcus simulans]|uniref:YveK family protein n=1 Tax=Staphylococcus TaxID=1279 RepID=UPI0008AA457D|nr:MULTISPECIES: Wzz/FepE/Etk N-terminal domain-containing protein [Staphylococcus]MDK7926328.1 Wzz/FepE/Etk N-terminal domain-containing protein [Staphylococcus simulans]MDK8314824.1 Wzz/FepE/Etk N-terminal domain-containing protein [Staphylococcus simulans]OHR52552.1 capsule biosynthesis protein CapA [Staphylococcus sp. HMSC056D08]OHS49629.1 capsule biosynthesis protein CapA [Staphylococcus sp. HMSC65H10]UXR46833.1 Wzz/FepE/Etk N-terminal domain-containing protein [Staphylococcus simulans]